MEISFLRDENEAFFSPTTTLLTEWRQKIHICTDMYIMEILSKRTVTEINGTFLSEKQFFAFQLKRKQFLLGMSCVYEMQN